MQDLWDFGKVKGASDEEALKKKETANRHDKYMEMGKRKSTDQEVPLRWTADYRDSKRSDLCSGSRRKNNYDPQAYG